MAFDPLKAVLNPANRLWSIPVISAGAACAAFAARAGQGGTPRMVVEAMVAGGLGFLIAAAWTTVETSKGKARKTSLRAEELLETRQSRRDVEALRTEILALEGGLHCYLDAKKQEGVKLRNAIIDLNNDVARLKDESPVQQLKPQLEAIAEKFGELSSVRQAVGKLSIKMRRVEAIGQQVAEAEARISSNAARPEETGEDRQAIARLREEFGKLKVELSGELKRDLSAVIEQTVTEQTRKVDEKVDAALAAKAGADPVAQSIEIDEVVDRVYANLDELIDGRVDALVKGLRRVSGVMHAVGDVKPAQSGAFQRPGLRLVGAGVSAANEAVSAPYPAAKPDLSVVPNSGSMMAVDGGKIETLELRLTKMADILERLQDKIDNIRVEAPAAGASSDDGIPSRFRKPVGIDVKAPENAVKGGCLAKLFQANLDLNKKLAA